MRSEKCTSENEFQISELSVSEKIDCFKTSEAILKGKNVKKIPIFFLENDVTYFQKFISEKFLRLHDQLFF